MALTDNSKKIMVILIAVIIGLGACAGISVWATNKINENTAQLKEEYDAKQKEMQAQLAAQAEAQTNQLRQEIQTMRQEQEKAMQEQAAALQAAQQAQVQAQQAAAKKPKPALALRTPAGKRAVTVLIDSLAAVGGLINAGDSVDVIAHLNVPEEAGDKASTKKTVTAMIFQNLQVLAVNTNLDEPGMYDDQQAAPSLKITFAVDPQEAGLLAFADTNGKLELALRGADEHDKQIVKASTWKTLADYVLQNQGSSITNPDGDSKEESTNEDTKPNIQIFRGGKEL